MVDFDEVLTRVRLHHVLAAISKAHYGLGASASSYCGTSAAGCYAFDRGDGSRCWASWSAVGVVLLAFDAMVDGAQQRIPAVRRDLSLVFDGVPPELSKLVAEVGAASEGLGSAGLWALRGGSTDGLGHVDGLGPFVGGEQESVRALTRFFSVAPKQAELASDLAARAVGATIVLTPAEVRILRRPPRPESDMPEGQWRQAVEMLRSMRIYSSEADVPSED